MYTHLPPFPPLPLPYPFLSPLPRPNPPRALIPYTYLGTLGTLYSVLCTL